MTLFFSQSIIASPKYGKLVSQECTLFELFEKQKAERITNGVVGRRGRIAPIIPKIRETQPRMKKIDL